jgi:hypothetical protein
VDFLKPDLSRKAKEKLSHAFTPEQARVFPVVRHVITIRACDAVFCMQPPPILLSAESFDFGSGMQGFDR